MLAISYFAFDLEFHPRRIRQSQSDDRHRGVSRTLDRFDSVISSPIDLRGDGVRNTSQAQRRFSTNQITDRIIGSAITIHRRLGPGLLEAAYESCLAYELDRQGLVVVQQKAVPLIYEHVKLECGFRADLLVENRVVVELKCKEQIHPVDEAQLLSHLRLLGLQVGLLINFHVVRLKDGIRRMVNNYREQDSDYECY